MKRFIYPNVIRSPADIGNGSLSGVDRHMMLWTEFLTSNIVRTVKDENGTSYEIASNGDQNSTGLEYINIATYIESTES